MHAKGIFVACSAPSIIIKSNPSPLENEIRSGIGSRHFDWGFDRNV